MKIKYSCMGLLAAILVTGIIPLTAQEPDNPDDQARQAQQDERDRRLDPDGSRSRRDARDRADANRVRGTVDRGTVDRARKLAPEGYRNFTTWSDSDAPTAMGFATQPGGGSLIYSTRYSMDAEMAKEINASNEEVSNLIKELKETDDDARQAELKDKIKSELDLQYDAYLTHHEKPLKQLEERLAKLRQEFDSRKAAKDDLVKLRLDTIWYDSQGLGWPNNRGRSGFFSNGGSFGLGVGPGGSPAMFPQPPTAPEVNLPGTSEPPAAPRTPRSGR